MYLRTPNDPTAAGDDGLIAQISARLASEQPPYAPYLHALLATHRDQLIQWAALLPQDPSLHIYGAPTQVIAYSQGLVRYPARYALFDASQMIPSHVPAAEVGLFRAHPQYPPGLQERRYHTDAAEVQKVRRNAVRFDPSLVINTNPDVVNGPPVVDANGFVLGGNSRAMSMQLVYRTGRGDLIRDALLASCSPGCFGLYPSEVTQVHEPVLVRVMDFDSLAAPEEARQLVRLFNVSMTQEMDPSTAAVAQTRNISAAQWQELARFVANNLKSDETFNNYLLSNRSAALIDRLLHIGVFSARTISKYTYGESHKNAGLLNSQGRRFVARLLVAQVVPEPAIFDRLTNRLVDTLDKVAPFIVATGCCDPVWDITSQMFLVLRAISDLPAMTPKAFIESLTTQDAWGGGAVDALRDDPTGRAMLLYHATMALGNAYTKFGPPLRAYVQRAIQSSTLSLFGPSGDESVGALAEVFGMVRDPRSPSGWRVMPTDPLIGATS